MADFRKFLNHLRLEKPTFLLIIYPRCNFYLLSGIQSLWGIGCIKDRGKFHKSSIFCLHHHNSDFFFFFSFCICQNLSAYNVSGPWENNIYFPGVGCTTNWFLDYSFSSNASFGVHGRISRWPNAALFYLKHATVTNCKFDQKMFLNLVTAKQKVTIELKTRLLYEWRSTWRCVQRE